jgi:hypothetical protein
MSTPFAFQGSLQIPADGTLPPDPIPFNGAGAFDSKQESVLNLPAGAGSTDVAFGTAPAAGVKGLFIRYDPVAGAPPVQLVINGSATPIELSSGGFVAYFSPTPAAGITSLTITRTAAAVLRIWVLG